MKPQVVSTVNPYINNIRLTLGQNQKTEADWLILTHNDPQLLARLNGTFPDSTVAMLPLPQNCWHRNNKMMAEVVAWAIRELNVKGVLLVGHSQGGAPEEKIWPASRNQTKRLSASSSFTERVKNAQIQVAHAQAHFMEQAESLSRTVAIESQLTQKQTPFYGLFYRGESDAFLAYDRRQRSFKPLKSETTVA